jgi:PPOX class probable F420-dependent enzyme
MQLSATQLQTLLNRWPIARLATVGDDGRPHQVPVVFALHGGSIYSPIDGKRKRGAPLQRLRNVVRRPQVSLLLDHYDADWQSLWWVRIDAIASVHLLADMHDGAVVESALRAKYPQYAEVPLFRDTPTLLCLEVVDHVAWSASSATVPSSA